MSFKQEALGGLSKESDEAVLVRGKAVLLAMTDNPNFLTPEPALETVTEILDDYDQKLAMAKRRGNPEDTAACLLVGDKMNRMGFYTATLSQAVDFCSGQIHIK